jgi:hypothetical protein
LNTRKKLEDSCYYYATAQNTNPQHTRRIDASIPHRKIWQLAANNGLFHRTNQKMHPGELGFPYQQRNKSARARMDLHRTPARGERGEGEDDDAGRTRGGAAAEGRLDL